MTNITERLRSRSPYLDGSSAERTMDEAADEIEHLQGMVASLNAELLTAEANIERLRAALQNLMNDVLEYERINNLAPSPGKQDCWQSVTDARRALETKP